MPHLTASADSNVTIAAYTAQVNLPDTLRTADGLTLRLRHWPAAAANTLGTVLVVHGLGEHIGRYAHVAAHLNSWGWQVVGFDQRGHGTSEGEHGAIGAPDSLLCDLALVVDAVRAAQLAPPMLLLGHSMGGTVAARFVAEGIAGLANDSPAPWHRPVDALVLSSPALDTGMNVAEKLALTALLALAPQRAMSNRLKPEWISRDPAVVAAYIADPLVHDRITPLLLRFIVDGGELVQQRAAHWRVPTLLLWAGADRCAAPAGSAAFAVAAPAGVVTPHEFAPLAHEIFNEPEQDEVFAALQRWLAALH